MNKNEIIDMLHKAALKAMEGVDTLHPWSNFINSIESEREGEKPWELSYGMKYWSIESDGTVFVDTHEGHETDLRRITFGNVFPTQQKAIEAADAIKEFLKGRE